MEATNRKEKFDSRLNAEDTRYRGPEKPGPGDAGGVDTQAITPLESDGRSEGIEKGSTI